MDVAAFQGIAESFGITWDFLLGGTAAVMIVTQFAKKNFKLKGYWSILPAALMAFIIALKSATDPAGVILGTIILVIAASGSWELVKGAVKKVGNGGS